MYINRDIIFTNELVDEFKFKKNGIISIDYIPENNFFEYFLKSVLDVNTTILLRLYGKYEHGNSESFKKIVGLERLQFDPYQLKDITFLNMLKNLKVLILGFPTSKAVSLKPVLSLTKINSLVLVGNFLELETVSQLKNLKYFSISYNEDFNCSYLKDYQKLRSLRISNCKLQEPEFLKKLEKLEYLSLNKVSGIESLDFISGLKNLIYLEISNFKKKITIPDFSNCKNLKRIAIEKLDNIIHLERIVTAENLVEFKFKNVDYPNYRDFHFLLDMPALQNAYVIIDEVEKLTDILEANNIKTDMSVRDEFLSLTSPNMF